MTLRGVPPCCLIQALDYNQYYPTTLPLREPGAPEEEEELEGGGIPKDLAITAVSHSRRGKYTTLVWEKCGKSVGVNAHNEDLGLPLCLRQVCRGWGCCAAGVSHPPVRLPRSLFPVSLSFNSAPSLATPHPSPPSPRPPLLQPSPPSPLPTNPSSPPNTHPPSPVSRIMYPT